MANDYLRLHDHCCCIIMENMKKYPLMPPSAFSAAVHSQVMHQDWYDIPQWRVVCAVFEYTCMEISAVLKHREVEKQKQEAAVADGLEKMRQAQYAEGENAKNNRAAVGVYRYLWEPQAYNMITETHEKAHATHSTTQDILQRLEILQRMIEEQPRAK